MLFYNLEAYFGDVWQLASVASNSASTSVPSIDAAVVSSPSGTNNSAVVAVVIVIVVVVALAALAVMIYVWRRKRSFKVLNEEKVPDESKEAAELEEQT